jgi:hypothetical protein
MTQHDHVISQLGDLGYAHFEYDSKLEDLLSKLLDAWKGIIFKYKDNLNFLAQTFPFENDKGFELKTQKGTSGSGDLKCNFHVAPDVVDEFIKRANGDEYLIRYINLVCEVNSYVQELMTPFIRELAKISEVDFADDMIAYIPSCSTRALHYFAGQEPGVEIAADHCDRGVFTLTLVEDMSGLEFLSSVKRKWRKIQNQVRKMMLMPGMGTQRITNGKIKALPHRVVAGPDSLKRPRNSIVMFFDLPFDKKYLEFIFNKKANKATSKLGKKGWNFDMETAEFNKLFGGFPEGATGVD